MKQGLLQNIFFILFILSWTSSPGQQVLVQKVIHWTGIEQIRLSEDITSDVLTFSGSVMSEETGLLPVYQELLDLPLPGHGVTAKISGEVFEAIPADAMAMLDDRELIAEYITVSADVCLVRKVPFACISFVPLRYNKSLGQYEKLLSFTLTIEPGNVSSMFFDNARAYATESVLATGNWHKVITRKTGVHIITFEDLSKIGLDLAGIDPRDIRIYGNGNGMLPEPNSEERPDDLIENAIYIKGEEDGKFDPDDYILFYGLGPTIWKYNVFSKLFEHQVNLYDDRVVYFLTADLGPGKRIAEEYPIQDEHTHLVTSFTDFAYHEEENINILKTGKYWYGEEYKTQVVYTYPFHFPSIDMGAPVSLRTNVAARSSENSFFHFRINGDNVLTAEVSRINVLSTVYAWSTTPDSISFYPSGDLIEVEVEYDKTSSIAVGWMNYIELNARRHLSFEGGQLIFRDQYSHGTGNIAKYQVSKAQQGMSLWDVTHFDYVMSIPYDVNEDVLTFKAEADQLRQFVLFDLSDLYPVELGGAIENQNLHGLDPKDFIIVTHPLFMEEAKRLAVLHEKHDNLSSLIATPEQIYNEFSSGRMDMTAIRDFCKMLYDRADTSNIPRYLLLLGDGSYDPRDRNGETGTFMPAFQSRESLKLGYSFVTDDFFGLYDPNEGNNAYAKSVDIGIGRFPVSTVEQARGVVDKIEKYLSGSDSVMGDWRNKICFVADDEDNNTHFKQAEQLALIFDTAQVYNLDKIYLDAYTQVSTPSGHRYPDVNNAIDDMVNDGLLIFNYTGHGGEYGLSHEKVLDIPMINSWTNFNKLPLFITATCEFSRFDDPDIISAGEWVILNPDGGSIGIFTTTRLAWSDPNFKLNKIIYEEAFKRIDGEYPRLGDLIRIAKTEMNTSQNVKNFVLLGDPALQLAYPRHWVETDSVVALDHYKSNDTMQAMAHITVYGRIKDYKGAHLEGFNGLLYPTVYDKRVSNKTLGNDASSYPASFDLQQAVLFKGLFRVSQGRFEFSFVMPKDIAYDYGKGEISYYAYDTASYEDAHGYEEVLIGGVDDDVEMDYNGPLIDLFMNNMDFRDGDYTDSNPLLLAFFHDEQGINTFGNGIGHNMVMYLDGQTNDPIYLDKLYAPDIETYKSGRVTYPFYDLEDGLHTLRVKAWDLYNNPSEEEISFYVNVEGQLELDQAYNYPNPFSETTTFHFSHNKPGNEFTVEINVYNILGQRVSTLRSAAPSGEGEFQTITWDGRGNSGELLQGGVYVYTMKVTDQQGTYLQLSQKLIIAR